MADNVNISPDMIKNLLNILENNGINNNSEKKEENANNSNNKDNSYRMEASSIENDINFETILKIKSIMDNLNNSNNEDSRLLYSLKPYLRKSRQKKLDQYINILKISQISKIFNQKGDEN